PVANAGVDISAVVGQTVQLDGRGSSDADRDTLTYRWSLTSRPTGSSAVLVNDTQARPYLTLDLFGRYVAQLIVNDGRVDSTPDTVSVIATDMEGGCTNPPEPPDSITASDGFFPDRVEIFWSAAPGATEYRVYRSPSNDPVTAAPVSGWMNALVFSDASAAPADSGGCGGCGGATGPRPTYFYWVRARSAENCASGLAGPVVGYTASAKGWFLPVPLHLPTIPGLTRMDGDGADVPGGTLYVRLPAAATVGDSLVFLAAGTTLLLVARRRRQTASARPAPGRKTGT
ncbi:MAG TPA: hypothetical protein PKL84_15465, partial [Candidatus Hydrogenedentes bacterium]|nr:hypothetical protein [Candidatus Hydrogenedentota bacterium]